MKDVRGFTLIELLVVISIVGMLSSVVVSSTQSAREKGRIAGGVKFATHVHHGYGDRALGFWSLNDELTDSSGNNRTAILFGPASYVADRYLGTGKSLSLNNAPGNSGQYVTFVDSGPTSPFATKEITLSAWIKTSANISGDYQTIISFYSYYAMALCTGGHLAAYGGGTDFSPWSSSGQGTCPSIKSPQSLTDGRWHQVTMTTRLGVENGTTLYVDGRVVATGQLLDSGPYGDIGELSIGSKRWGPAGPPTEAQHGYTGYIANVAIYPATLTATEVGRIYAAESRNPLFAAVK